MIDIDSDDHIWLHDTCHHATTETADLFVGSKSTEIADILHGISAGQDAGSFLDDETTETVIKIGTDETIRTESAADGAIEQKWITGTDSQRLDLLLALISTELQLKIKLVRLDALASITHGRFCKMDGPECFHGPARDAAVLARLFWIFREERDLVSYQCGG